MTQWLFNFVIAKVTPLMLADITYGTYLVFGSCCVLMVIFTVICIPETKNVPLESIHLLFEGNIIRGAMRDTFAGRARYKALQTHSHVRGDESVERTAESGKAVAQQWEVPRL